MKKQKKEFAVIFQRIEEEGLPTEFIPQNVVIGNLTEDNKFFVDQFGNHYLHMVYNYSEYGFGLRGKIEDLRQIYKAKSLDELMVMYLKALKKHYYYVVVSSEITTNPKNAAIVAENKITHNSVILTDEDFENIINQQKSSPTETSEIQPTKAPTKEINTKEILKNLKANIIGQDRAIDQIISIIWQNYHSEKKSNMLIMGPTGVGKTQIFRNIAKELNVPIVIANATELTQTGYIGESADAILKNLLHKCNNNVAEAEKGIIVIDEIDKIASNPLSAEQIATTGVQDELLKLTEDGTYFFKLGSFLQQKKVEISTKGITFIGVGAFDKLTMEEPIKEKAIIGFAAKTSSNTSTKTIENDLIKYGLKPELIGRFPNIIHLDPLSKESLIKILKNPNNDTVVEKIKILETYNINLIIQEAVYELLAENAIQKNVGARGLTGEVDRLFNEAMLEISKDSHAYSELIIDRETVENPEHYTLIKRKNK